ncbi:MAG: 16S rRNA (cytidine(1402)-2'-O)-methyltransferase [Candidatus Margulisbacteria bacterium]|nr:16S rRNA (cytidine(1402)-2'-O)-methyltransferase [Candidatus Margulisiibacteriota bacterium]
MSLRVIHTFKKVDLIAAEDTRKTQILLQHFNIKKPLLSYYDYNKKYSAENIIKRLSAGQQVALVSDAGTPGIADPGYFLIKQALENNIQVIPLPGPSAVITALSAAGLATDKFVFEGYLPRKENELKKYLNSIKPESRTLVFYEAPHRLVTSLKNIYDLLGKRNICIARELTKKFEEIFRGSTKQALEHFKNIAPRGEFTLIISGNKETTTNIEELKPLMLDLIRAGLAKKETAKILSAHFKLSKNELYNKLLEWNK